MGPIATIIAYAKIAGIVIAICGTVYLGYYIYSQGRQSVLANIATTSLTNQATSDAIFNKQQIKTKKQLCLDLSGNDATACDGLPN